MSGRGITPLAASEEGGQHSLSGLKTSGPQRLHMGSLCDLESLLLDIPKRLRAVYSQGYSSGDVYSSMIDNHEAKNPKASQCRQWQNGQTLAVLNGVLFTI